MSSLLSVDPMKRCKCSEALKQPYFSNRPHPTPGPMLPMPSSLSNDDETSANDLNFLPGSGRKLREGFETSGLAKKLVFWSVIFFFHCFSCKYKNKVIWWFFLVLEKQLELCWNLFLLHRLECKTQSLPVWLHHLQVKNACFLIHSFSAVGRISN